MLDLLDSTVEQFGPQEGPQAAFLASAADIAIFGGSAGGGKTFGLLLEASRHIDNPEFGGVIFRRQAIQVKSQGGLWDTSFGLYAQLGGIPTLSPYPCWTFESGARLTFNHLTSDTDLLSWQGSQIAFIGFDELTHFGERQFFYMLSRNRSVSSIKPYIRATTNPDADSWVAKLIEWWIDQETGFAIPARSGIVRWFIRVDDTIHWADSAKELEWKFPNVAAKSLTFIPSKLTDNKILVQHNPEYLANLMALPRVDRERLLNGNWKIRPQSGSYFPRTKVGVLNEVPTDIKQFVRKYDLAATAPSEVNPSPDATACVLMGRRENGRFVIVDAFNLRENAHIVRETIKNVAEQDKARFHPGISFSPTGKSIVTIVPIDPGQAGKEQAQSLVNMLAGHNVKAIRESGSKVTRAEPFSSQWQAGNVDVVAGQWNNDYLTEMEIFPEGNHDDYIDASSGCFLELVSKVSSNARRLALAS